MCEIKITEFFKGETWDFTGSIATHGPNAGPMTWANSKKEAASTPLLTTEEQLDAMRSWAKETGAWDKDEIAAWDATEINALFIQLVAGDMREAGLDDIDFDDAKAWRKYEKGAEAGRYSGNIYKSGVDVYYSLSN